MTNAEKVMFGRFLFTFCNATAAKRIQLADFPCRSSSTGRGECGGRHARLITVLISSTGSKY